MTKSVRVGIDGCSLPILCRKRQSVTDFAVWENVVVLAWVGDCVQCEAARGAVFQVDALLDAVGAQDPIDFVENPFEFVWGTEGFVVTLAHHFHDMLGEPSSVFAHNLSFDVSSGAYDPHRCSGSSLSHHHPESHVRVVHRQDAGQNGRSLHRKCDASVVVQCRQCFLDIHGRVEHDSDVDRDVCRFLLVSCKGEHRRQRNVITIYHEFAERGTKVTEQSVSDPGGVNLEAIEGAVRTILEAVGEDPERSGLEDTPRRVAKMYAEMFSGLHQDPSRHLRTSFPEEYDEMVLVRDIEFTSMCEHHLLPFSGFAHVAYIPNGQVTGLSKLARR